MFGLLAYPIAMAAVHKILSLEAAKKYQEALEAAKQKAIQAVEQAEPKD